MSISNVFSALTEVFTLLMNQFTTVVSTINNNPLLYVPVLCGLGGGIVIAGVKLVRKLGVRGIGGKRRRR